jgi:hypothetical protein
LAFATDRKAGKAKMPFPSDPRIFVFGSNTYNGNGFLERTYAIPTMDWRGDLRPIDCIKQEVRTFLVIAAQANGRFQISTVGVTEAMAPLFSRAPLNCDLPVAWERLGLPRTPISMRLGPENCPDLTIAPEPT